MKKKIVLLPLIILLLLASCHNTDYSQTQADFEMLLSAGDYAGAKDIYDAADEEMKSKLNESIETYAAEIAAMAQSAESPDDARQMLDAFSIFDDTNPEIEQALQSISANEQAIAKSVENYAEGMQLYAGRDFETAGEYLSLVIEADANYLNAQNMLSDIVSRSAQWDAAAESGKTGRSPYVNSLAYSEGCVYFPVEKDGVHSIAKCRYETGETELLALTDITGAFRIQAINVIGDYLYFIAGEELGRGLMLQSPYNIYEMKTDGTALAMVKAGDYFDLISDGDIFYALSYTKGLVKMDRNFENEAVISANNIIEMQPCGNGIYYTEKLNNTHDSMHIFYYYEDGESAEVMRNEMLHAYAFDGGFIYYFDMKNNFDEEVFFTDSSFENPQRLAMMKEGNEGDINNIIGVLGDTAMFNLSGPEWAGGMRQNIYTEIDISRKLYHAMQSPLEVPPYEVINILYEENMLFIKDFRGDYFFSAGLPPQAPGAKIEFTGLNTEQLDKNAKVIAENRPKEEEYFTADEIVTELDSFWCYSSPNLSVRIEAVYDEAVETMIYITNIRTKDHSGFDIGYSNKQAPGVYGCEQVDDIAVINNAVFATNSDFAITGENPWIAKVIRDGRVFDGMKAKNYEYSPEEIHDVPNENRDFLAMYPDGTMAAYMKEDGITYGELLDAGVKNMLSFGPILIRDGERTPESLQPGYFLSRTNPRCAWGMVEPGHYVNIVADGREDWVNRGMTFYDLSGYFQKLGCSVAYNLDGGLSSSIVFMGRFLNTHKVNATYFVHRPVQEIVYFGVSDLVPAQLENYYTH